MSSFKYSTGVIHKIPIGKIVFDTCDSVTFIRKKRNKESIREIEGYYCTKDLEKKLLAMDSLGNLTNEQRLTEFIKELSKIIIEVKGGPLKVNGGKIKK